jgi:hypothetical protein
LSKKATNPRLQAQVTPELKKITDMMLEHLDMTQAQFFEKYLPTMFLALDKEKFLEVVSEVYNDVQLKKQIEKLK